MDHTISTDYNRQLLDAIPIPVFVINEELRIVDANRAAGPMLGVARSEMLMKRSGEMLHCVHTTDTAEGCGYGPECNTCIIRNSVLAAIQGKQTSRNRTRVIRRMDNEEREIDLLVTAAPIPGNEKRILLILEDISEIARLRTLIPMCAHCRRIRTEEQYWQSVEVYLRENHSLDVSHGLCMECAEELYPEFARVLRQKKNNGAAPPPP